MDIQSKCVQLRRQIVDALVPLIDDDYVLLDVPYHENIGDYLIWEGEERFLSQIPHKCLYRASCKTYRKPKIGKNVVVLLQGGGNWGDVWREYTEFKKRVISDFPDNRVLILPNTVHYKDESLFVEDMRFLQAHSHVVFCARDRRSYERLMNAGLKDRVLMLPDFAFFLSYDKPSSGCGNLFLRRDDLEFKQDEGYSRSLPAQYDVKDWPTFEKRSLLYALRPTQRFWKYIDRFGIVNRWFDCLEHTYILPYTIREGVHLLSKYETVFSTRMHGAILAALLGKRVVMFDNSYGKNQQFYDSWLSDLDNFEMVSVN